MSAYFIVTIHLEETRDRSPYDAYIEQVRPVVEGFGGEYLVRTEAITPFAGDWHPDRLIIIKFPNRETLAACFSSEAYRSIMSLRTETVKTKALIAEGL